jgi:hypothetical protein
MGLRLGRATVWESTPIPSVGPRSAVWTLTTRYRHPTAMRLLAPKKLSVNDLVQARDTDGHWYNAKVIGKSGRGASVAVTGSPTKVIG